MKSLIAFASVLALSVVPVFAGEGHVTDQSLAKMGLHGMQPLTDAQGMTIRGQSATAGGFSVATLGTSGGASSSYYAGGHQSAAGYSVSSASITVNYYTHIAAAGGFSAATTH